MSIPIDKIELRYYRENAGLSQVALARRAGKDATLVWKLESDPRKTHAAPASVKALADAMDVPVDVLRADRAPHVGRPRQSAAA